jgi:hypothetical protein
VALPSRASGTDGWWYRISISELPRKHRAVRRQHEPASPHHTSFAALPAVRNCVLRDCVPEETPRLFETPSAFWVAVRHQAWTHVSLLFASFAVGFALRIRPVLVFSLAPTAFRSPPGSRRTICRPSHFRAAESDCFLCRSFSGPTPRTVVVLTGNHRHCDAF